MPSLDFSWNSPNPHDPEDFNQSWDTPEVREAARQEDTMKAFTKGISQQVGKKSSLSDMLVPMITIAVVIAVGYLVYQLSGQLAYQGQVLDQILQKLGMVP